MLFLEERKGVLSLSPLAGLTSEAGEKPGVEKVVLYGVPETDTEYGIETFL